LTFICDCEKHRFLCGFCIIASVPYHDDRPSVVQQGEELYGDRKARRRADVLLVPQVDNSRML
jgi:hypothetical protein